MNKKFVYTKEHYFKSKLKRLEGKDFNKIPPHVIELIRTKLNGQQANKLRVRVILKEERLVKFYEYIPTILNILDTSIVTSIRQAEPCPVCLEDVTSMKTMNCKHQFCVLCVNKIIDESSFKCPLCRAVFSEEIQRISLTEKEMEVVMKKFNEHIFSSNKNTNFTELMNKLLSECGYKIEY